MQNPTRLEVKTRLTGVMTYDMDMDLAIQELVERAYDELAIPDATRELDIEIPTDFYTDGQGRQFILIDADAYNCALKFKVGKTFYNSVSINSLYQIPNNGAYNFVDYGEEVITSTNKRKYLVPTTLISTQIKTLNVLVKVRAPIIDDDATVLPFRNVGQVKNGLLAIGYENSNDRKLANECWQAFRYGHEQSTQQYEGPKKTKIVFKDGLARKPNGFR